MNYEHVCVRELGSHSVRKFTSSNKTLKNRGWVKMREDEDEKEGIL